RRKGEAYRPPSAPAKREAPWRALLWAGSPVCAVPRSGTAARVLLPRAPPRRLPRTRRESPSMCVSSLFLLLGVCLLLGIRNSCGDGGEPGLFQLLVERRHVARFERLPFRGERSARGLELAPHRRGLRRGSAVAAIRNAQQALEVLAQRGKVFLLFSRWRSAEEAGARGAFQRFQFFVERGDGIAERCFS